MEHPARKITQIAREAEHIVLLAMRQDEIGTAEIDCIHALRHHPGITQTELAGMLHARPSPAIARRTASLERKGYLRREPNPEDGRSQLLFATPQAEGLRNAKAETESAFYDYLMGWSQRKRPRDVFKPARRGLSPLQSGKPRGLPPSERRIKGKNE